MWALAAGATCPGATVVGRGSSHGWALGDPDQLVDRTMQPAPETDFDQAHATLLFAILYRLKFLRLAATEICLELLGPPFFGHAVVIEGRGLHPRRSWFAAQGWTLVGMNWRSRGGAARELALVMLLLALVTDTDAGKGRKGEGRHRGQRALRGVRRDIKRLRDLVAWIIAALPLSARTTSCTPWTALPLSFPLP